MPERKLTMLAYGIVLGVVSMAMSQAYPDDQVETLCLVVIASGIAYVVAVMLGESLETLRRR